MNDYEWKSVSDKYYYYNKDTGKITVVKKENDIF